MKQSLVFLLLVGLLGVLLPSLLWAGAPNIVLSQTLHFSSSEGTVVTLDPGKYFIEQSASSQLRLTPEGDTPGVTIQAEPLTHEQYELFSPMALTRPQKKQGYVIELFLPGGVRLKAVGSTTPPPDSPKPVDAQILAPQPPMTHEPESIGTITSPANRFPPPPPQERDVFSDPSLSNAGPLNDSLPRYQAPDPSSPERRVIVDERQSENSPVYLAALSPEHIGLTMFEQPALFWYLAHPASQPVDMTIKDKEHEHLLLDVRMLPPIQPGIHKVELKDYGIRLQPQMTYQWTIILRGKIPGEDHTTSGWILRRAPPAHMAAVAQFPSMVSISPRALVEAGFWYDAVWVLSERIIAHPMDSLALTQRAGLFEQVGLRAPAQQDRARLPFPSREE